MNGICDKKSYAQRGKKCLCQKVFLVLGENVHFFSNPLNFHCFHTTNEVVTDLTQLDRRKPDFHFANPVMSQR